jgi:hypothetical protein
MFLHLSHPTPQIAKHLTSKYRFLKPIGTFRAPTNFAFEAQNLNEILQVLF